MHCFTQLYNIFVAVYNVNFKNCYIFTTQLYDRVGYYYVSTSVEKMNLLTMQGDMSLRWYICMIFWLSNNVLCSFNSSLVFQICRVNSSLIRLHHNLIEIHKVVVVFCLKSYWKAFLLVSLKLKLEFNVQQR